MLRARPVHFTSRMEPWERLLTDLGMIKTLDDDSWKEFDAWSGRLALQHTPAGTADDGTTSFGVEVGDPEEFARRTNLAGAETGTTPAELVPPDIGDSCRITGADGFTFMADKAAHSFQCADAWLTPTAWAARGNRERRPRPHPGWPRAACVRRPPPSR